MLRSLKVELMTPYRPPEYPSGRRELWKPETALLMNGKVLLHWTIPGMGRHPHAYSLSKDPKELPNSRS